MAIQDTFTLGLIIVNIALTIVLMIIYVKNYKAIKSKITLGLLFFALAFLLENVIDFYFYNFLIGQSIFGFTTIHSSINLIEMVGLLILLYVTWK